VQGSTASMPLMIYTFTKLNHLTRKYYMSLLQKTISKLWYVLTVK